MPDMVTGCCHHWLAAWPKPDRLPESFVVTRRCSLITVTIVADHRLISDAEQRTDSKGSPLAFSANVSE